MFNKYFIPFRTIALSGCLLLILCQCNRVKEDPRKDGQKVGLEYAKSIGQLLQQQNENVSDLIKRKDACFNSFDLKLASLEKKYLYDKNDGDKIHHAFEAASYPMRMKLNKVIATKLTRILNNKVWLKKGEPDKTYYLCYFQGQTLHLVNSHKYYPYELHGDTMIFHDNLETRCLIRVPGPEQFMIISCRNKDVFRTFTVANTKDLIVGKWIIPDKESLLVSFYPHAGATVAKVIRPGQYLSCSYAIKGEQLRVANRIFTYQQMGKDSIMLKNGDRTMIVGRIKGTAMNNMDFLFKN